MTSAVVTGAPPPPPDWSTIGRDVECPLCGYNLRGLAEPRCPECGYASTWDRLLDPHAQHPYLFEHHPRHNVWSFTHTFLAHLRPRRFWTTLRPEHEIHVRRLILYWLLAASLILVGYVPTMVDFAIRSPAYFRPMSWWDVLRALATWDSDLKLPILAWPWLTLATLLIFRQSLARVRVRPVHLLRVALYCGDGVLWLMLVLTLVLPRLERMSVLDDWATVVNLPDALVGIVLMRQKIVLVAVPALFVGWRMSAACRDYLHIDHPRWVVLASQLMVAMFVIAVRWP